MTHNAGDFACIVSLSVKYKEKISNNPNNHTINIFVPDEAMHNEIIDPMASIRGVVSLLSANIFLELRLLFMSG